MKKEIIIIISGDFETIFNLLKTFLIFKKKNYL